MLLGEPLADDDNGSVPMAFRIFAADLFLAVSLTPLHCSPSSEPYASRRDSQEHSTHPSREGGERVMQVGERVRATVICTIGSSASWHFVS